MVLLSLSFEHACIGLEGWLLSQRLGVHAAYSPVARSSRSPYLRPRPTCWQDAIADPGADCGRVDSHEFGNLAGLELVGLG
jgi:hypothetical protein